MYIYYVCLRQWTLAATGDYDIREGDEAQRQWRHTTAESKRLSKRIPRPSRERINVCRRDAATRKNMMNYIANNKNIIYVEKIFKM